jgi:hypothetical protein
MSLFSVTLYLLSNLFHTPSCFPFLASHNPHSTLCFYEIFFFFFSLSQMNELMQYLSFRAWLISLNVTSSQSHPLTSYFAQLLQTPLRHSCYGEADCSCVQNSQLFLCLWSAHCFSNGARFSVQVCSVQKCNVLCTWATLDQWEVAANEEMCPLVS